MLNSPLEQFAIIPSIPVKIGNLYFPFTNSPLFLLLTTALQFYGVLLSVHSATKNGGNLVPNVLEDFPELVLI